MWNVLIRSPQHAGTSTGSAFARDGPAVVLALAVGIGAALLVVGSDRAATPTGVAAVVALLVGWTYIGSGLVARRQRPSNPLGVVMVVIGFAWFVTFLEHARDSLVFTIGTSLEVVYLAAFVYLILSFPSGRLPGVIDRAFFAAAVFLAVAVELAWLLLADSREIICADCPRNAFQVVRSDTLAGGILTAQRIAGVVLSIATVALLVRRWRKATRPQRQAAAPVLWVGSAMFVAIAISIGNDIAGEPLGSVADWIGPCVFAAIPIAVLAVLLKRRLARGAVAELVVELRPGTEAVDLRDALGRALGDPTLELAYWLPGHGRYVDPEGRPVELPQEGTGRLTTVVERGGEPVAALMCDVALRDNAELVDSVCAAAALTLENERLRAELLAKLEELKASRARLVEATESERRRIERDLHDGTQQRLVSVAMTLGLAESKLASDREAVGPALREARDSLALALGELRELSQGIRPAILVERGLGAALDDLGRRAALPVRLDVRISGRLPEQVETAAYFVASEALTNAAKHSHASEVRLAASCAEDTFLLEVGDDGIGGAGGNDGSGLRGLADRVEAIGGRLTISSPPGRGTVVRAEIPCA